MAKVTFEVKVSGTDFKGVLHTIATGKNENLKFKGTAKEGTCEKNLATGDYAWALITTGQEGDTFLGKVDGATPPAPPIQGKIPAGKTHGGGMRPFSVVEDAGTEGVAPKGTTPAKRRAAKRGRAKKPSTGRKGGR